MRTTAIGPRAATCGFLALPEADDWEEELIRSRRVSLTGGEAPLPEAWSGDEEILRSFELSAASEWDAEPCVLPGAQAHLHDPVDVVVAGYGTGGAFACVAAAEEGMTVTVLDPAPAPGGIGTAGRIHSYYHGLRGGAQDRLDEHVAGRGAQVVPAVRGYHPSGKADVLSRELRRCSVHVCAGQTVFGVVRDGERVTGVLTLAEDGFHAYPCQVAIDGTGDGDLAAAAGADVRFGRDGDGAPQPFSYTPSLVRDGVLHDRNFDAGWVDPTDTLDFSRAHLLGRERLWRQGPFSDETHYCTLASILGVRESRFIRGQATVCFDDLLGARVWPDAVCSAFAHHDNHAMDYGLESEWSRRHVVFFGLWRYLCHGQIPYGALVPAGVEGVLVACRALSVDHDAHQLIRMQRDLQVIGEVCGVAAALAVEGGVGLSGIEVPVLQQRLRGRGVRPKDPEPPLPLDTEALVAALDGDAAGLAMRRLSRLRPEQAPDWTTVLGAAASDDVRLRLAVCAALSDAVTPPSAEAVLREAAAAEGEAPPFGVKSPGRHVVAALALAEARAESALDPLSALLAQPGQEPAVILLLLHAFERLGDVQAVVPVRAFLAAAEDNAFDCSLWGAAQEDLTSFRQVIVIRAVEVLLNLGCRAELARLDPYLTDPRLTVRRFARRVVGKGEGV